MALSALKRWIERYGSGRRVHETARRPGDFEFAELGPLYFTATGLSRWPARAADASADELVPGVSLELDLGEAGRLTGEVLTRTPRECLLSWDERDAVLGLKAYTRPPAGRELCLDLNSWRLAEGQRPLLRAFLEGALERLAERLATRATTSGGS